MKLFIILNFILLFLFNSLSFAEECHPYCPTTKRTDLIKIDHRDMFSGRIDPTTKFAHWVGYKVTPLNLIGQHKERKWKVDPQLKGTLQLPTSTYTGASKECKYDRGHLAPAASFIGSLDYEKINYLSNIVPQHQSFNRGRWLQLEKRIREYVDGRKKTLKVLTGPVYNKSVKSCLLPNNTQLPIPVGYWKVIWIEHEPHSAIAFYMPQFNITGLSICSAILRIKELERITQLTFFPTVAYPISLDIPFVRSLGCNIN